MEAAVEIYCTHYDDVEIRVQVVWQRAFAHLLLGHSIESVMFFALFTLGSTTTTTTASSGRCRRGRVRLLRRHKIIITAHRGHRIRRYRTVVHLMCIQQRVR